MYSINVSGYIPAKKAKEFKQHMIQLVGQQSSELIRFSVFHNMMIEDLYQVEVQFQDKESMFSFLRSEEYAIISGSFRTLGLLQRENIIEYSDYKQ